MRNLLNRAEVLENRVLRGWIAIQDAVIPSLVRANQIHRLFSDSKVMVNKSTNQSFSVLEAHKTGAVLADLRGQVYKVEWVVNGKVDSDYIRNWSAASRQTRLLHELSEDFDNSLRS